MSKKINDNQAYYSAYYPNIIFKSDRICEKGSSTYIQFANFGNS